MNIEGEVVWEESVTSVFPCALHHHADGPCSLGDRYRSSINQWLRSHGLNDRTVIAVTVVKDCDSNHWVLAQTYLSDADGNWNVNYQQAGGFSARTEIFSMPMQTPPPGYRENGSYSRWNHGMEAELWQELGEAGRDEP